VASRIAFNRIRRSGQWPQPPDDAPPRSPARGEPPYCRRSGAGTTALADTTHIRLSNNQRLDWLRLIRSENVGPRGVAGGGLSHPILIARRIARLRRAAAAVDFRLWPAGGAVRGLGGGGVDHPPGEHHAADGGDRAEDRGGGEAEGVAQCQSSR
jgi:hypothetical protein